MSATLKGPNEELLAAALIRAGLPHFNRELRLNQGSKKLSTVPDFAYEDVRLAIYIDSARYHVGVDVQLKDSAKRDRLVLEGWAVLVLWTYWCRDDREADVLAARVKVAWTRRHCVETLGRLADCLLSNAAQEMALRELFWTLGSSRVYLQTTGGPVPFPLRKLLMEGLASRDQQREVIASAVRATRQRLAEVVA